VVHHHRPFTETVRADTGMSHFGGDFELARDFIGMIRGQRAPRATLWAGIQSIYTCLAAKESAETGRFVTVRQVGAG
jgi:predicted dehydrogenase